MRGCSSVQLLPWHLGARGMKTGMRSHPPLCIGSFEIFSQNTKKKKKKKKEEEKKKRGLGRQLSGY